MSKFKVGDKVRRINNDWKGMRIGDIGTVIGCENGALQLREYNFNGENGNILNHDSKNFELVVNRIKVYGIVEFCNEHYK